uniref:F-box/LRR-repeat protein 15/At3g58940/PEG3-like LRR domain-containing protein n=1 Tax=Hordeum vulgare subsp. vulgare TaxID=112509 RepID=A0A8I6YNQ2_HORVV
MIARSPSLEFLLIIRCTGARRPRINSFTLRTIAVDNHSPDPSIKELVIESAPHLQTLIHLDHNHDLHIAALSVPKLETLGCTNSTRLVFGSTDIRHHQALMKGPCIRGLATAACKIKCLVLGMATLNLHMVIELMTNFPCLEKLYIQVMIVLPIVQFLWLLY